MSSAYSLWEEEGRTAVEIQMSTLLRNGNGCWALVRYDFTSRVIHLPATSSLAARNNTAWTSPTWCHVGVDR